jgi:hypothetical protein
MRLEIEFEEVGPKDHCSRKESTALYKISTGLSYVETCPLFSLIFCTNVPVYVFFCNIHYIARSDPNDTVSPSLLQG